MWTPKIGEMYFFIGTNNVITSKNFIGASDSERLAQGNCFKTHEEAKQHLDATTIEVLKVPNLILGEDEIAVVEEKPKKKKRKSKKQKNEEQ